MKISTDPTPGDQALLFWLVAIPFLLPLFAWMISIPILLIAALLPDPLCLALLVAAPWASFGISGACVWALWRNLPRLTHDQAREPTV